MARQLSTRAKVFAKTDGHCAYCGKPLDPFVGWAIDHAVPRSQDGPDSLWNLFPACRRCNSRKRDRRVEEYASWYVFQISERVRQTILEFLDEPAIVWYSEPIDKHPAIAKVVIDHLVVLAKMLDRSDVHFYADEQFRAANLRHQLYQGQPHE